MSSTEALAAVFDNDDMATDAVYLPPSGPPLSPLRIMLHRQSEDDQPSGGDFAGRLRRLVKVRAAELDEPVKGGRFATALETVEIVAAPRRKDRHGLVWSCECRVVS